MTKRGKLEIIRDILNIINNNDNSIKITPLIRKSNMSSSRFKGYYSDLLQKEFVKENKQKSGKLVSLTDKGERFLQKYQTIISFIDEFEL